MIDLQGAVTREGKPFVIVSIDDEPQFQLTPSESMNFGTRAIMAGIEAERDAALLRAGRKLALDDGDSEVEATRFAAALLVLTREYRGQVDPDPRQDIPEGPRQ